MSPTDRGPTTRENEPISGTGGQHVSRTTIPAMDTPAILEARTIPRGAEVEGRGDETRPMGQGDHATRVLPTGASIGHHISALGRDAARLIQDEVKLAKLEVNEKIDKATLGVASLGSGVAFTLAGLTTLCGAATIALDLLLPLWAAALIVGGVVTALGLAMLNAGKNRVAEAAVPMPSDAIDEARTTGRMLTERAR